MTTLHRAATLAAGALGAALFTLTGVGCGAEGTARPLTAEAFVRQRPGSQVGNPVDQPGPVVFNDSPADPDFGDRAARAEADAQGPREHGIGKTVRESVRIPSAAAEAGNGATDAAAPATRPARTPPAVAANPDAGGDAGATGTGDATAAAPTTQGGARWMPVGFVLMEVNGNPVYVDKVLSAIEKPLEIEAKRHPPERFRKVAELLVANQVNLYKREELEFASADRQLGAEDKQLANGLTIQWRQKRITEAGGSLELARRKASADGWDFDELVRQQYRLHLVQIFYQKRVIPLIQVAAADIRAYYNANREKEFTTHGAAKFRLIKIDPAKHAGMFEEAYGIAQDVRKRAETEQFADLAERFNDDPGLKLTRGLIGKDGWFQQGAFRVDAVDKAVFAMRTGQVSDVIEDGSAGRVLYVVKLEELREGKVEQFEDPAIQDRIREKLRSAQFQALREKHVRELERNAITRTNEGTLQDAVDMVMMRYGQWAAATPGK